MERRRPFLCTLRISDWRDFAGCPRVSALLPDFLLSTRLSHSAPVLRHAGDFSVPASTVDERADAPRAISAARDSWVGVCDVHAKLLDGGARHTWSEFGECHVVARD